MGMALPCEDMIIADGEDGYLSDSDAVDYVVEALDKVASNMYQVERDQYEELLGIVDPSKRMNSEDEALLVTTMRALSQAVSKIDPSFHGSLLCNIYGLIIWNYGLDARGAVVELIVNMAAVPDKFLDGCLQMLVNNFLPPRKMRESISQTRWLSRKKEVHAMLHMALNSITDMVPLAPIKLKEIIDRRMPRYTEPKEVIVTFVECMLSLESIEIGEFLGITLVAKVVDLLIELDVNISWEDIVQEDSNKGIFEMELEDAEEGADGAIKTDSNPNEETGDLRGNAFADKLDGLMVVMCEYLKIRASEGHLLKVFDMLSESFRRTVLNAYKSKFAQFVMFYACSLDPENCGAKFASLLADIVLSKVEDPISRMSAAAYLASYLSRAKFISLFVVAKILGRLVEWCSNYCQAQNGQEKILDPKAHRVFYSASQAVMYILCFRMRPIMDIPELRDLLHNLPLEHILCHSLNPLMICLPSIVQEFLRQAGDAHLFKRSTPLLSKNLLESELSKSYGGVERLDMFFPFDPYLLKESDRFMRPSFEFWSMVKKTYSNCNSEDEDETGDLDVPDFSDEDENCEEHDDLHEDSDDEDLEYSMNKMSITPRPAFEYKLDLKKQMHAQMPARIRPSVSFY